MVMCLLVPTTAVSSWKFTLLQAVGLAQLQSSIAYIPCEGMYLGSYYWSGLHGLTQPR